MAGMAAVLLMSVFGRDVRAQAGNGPVPPPAEIRIDSTTVKHVTAGGVGPLWRAM